MLQSIIWQATDNLTRRQFAVFEQASDAARLSEAERRRTLQLSEQDWAAWSDFVSDGPLPSQPALPEMLQRLGTASYRLTLQGEQYGVAA